MKVQEGPDGDPLCDPADFDDPRNYRNYDPSQDHREFDQYLCEGCVKRHKQHDALVPVRRMISSKCKFSLDNSLHSVPVPTELLDLTWMEERCLAPVVACQTYVIVPYGLHARRGQVVHIPCDVSSNLEMLVPRDIPLGVEFAVLVRTSYTDVEKFLIYGHYTTVDMGKVYSAFKVLKRLKHPAFLNIQWPSNCPTTGKINHPNLVSEVVAENDQYDHVSHRIDCDSETEFENIDSMLESCVLSSNVDIPHLAAILENNEDDNSDDTDDAVETSNHFNQEDTVEASIHVNQNDVAEAFEVHSSSNFLLPEDDMENYINRADYEEIRQQYGPGDDPRDYPGYGRQAEAKQVTGYAPGDDPRDYPGYQKKCITLPPLSNESVMWNDVPGREEAAHFCLFPDGSGGFSDLNRPVKLTLREYVGSRLFGEDVRWSLES